jgi:hypothetical protein
VRRGGASAFALAVLATTLAAGAAPAAQAEPKLIECQQPARTGEEIYALHGVTRATACPVVRALARWEYHPASHITELYTCVGPGHHTPKLVRHRFDGWRLSIADGFVMSKGGASFKVTGTDFPLNCS